jgi:hypothetical protein
MKAGNFIVGLVICLSCFLARPLQLLAEDVGPPNFPAKVTRALLLATSNENDRFELVVYGPDPFSNSSFEAKIGSKSFHFGAGGSPSSQGIYSAETQVIGEDAAQDLIRFFKPVIRKRQHPGHRMLVKFIPAKKAFVVGEPVNVTLRITNVGDALFAYQQGGKQRGARDNQFAFSAQSIKDHKMMPDTGSPMHMGGLNGPVVVKPGESHEISVDLAKWFTFQKGDHYQIRGSYELELYDPTTLSHLDSDWPFVVWLDYATADFWIRFEP